MIAGWMSGVVVSVWLEYLVVVEISLWYCGVRRFCRPGNRCIDDICWMTHCHTDGVVW